MYYACPVCGFAKMENPPEDHFICPCCGTQFGYDDVAHSYEQLREAWISSGARWFNGLPPLTWNPWQQLAAAGLSYAVPFFGHLEWHSNFVEGGMLAEYGAGGVTVQLR